MSFSRLLGSLLISMTLLAVLGGCSKKRKKVQEMLQQPAAEAEKAPEPGYVPSDEDSFIEQQMDAEAEQTLVAVYFAFDSYDLRREEIGKLEKVGAFLTKHTSVRVLAEGHCDERGSNEYNMGLGENRARSVKDWLSAYGISPNRIESSSYGEEAPALPNCATRECHANNRRVVWKVLSK